MGCLKLPEPRKGFPGGKVATGALLARNPRRARVVGYALHSNLDPVNIPWHRVVNRTGKAAEGFVFGGGDVQRQGLEAEGIISVKSSRIDLEKHRR